MTTGTRATLEATVDAVGGLARALKRLDPAILPATVQGALKTMQGLFAVLIDAEGGDAAAEAAAGQAIAAEGARLVGLLAGVKLPPAVHGMVSYALA